MIEKRVLIAEKNQQFASGMWYLMERTDNYLPVFICSHCAELVESCQLMNVDVVLFDADTNWETCKGVVELLKKQQSDIKLIALSINPEKEYEQKYLEIGFDSFCCKYNVVRDLKALLDQLFLS